MRTGLPVIQDLGQDNVVEDASRFKECLHFIARTFPKEPRES